MNDLPVAAERPLHFKLPHLVFKPAMRLMAAAPQAMVDLFGWDSVFAIRLPDVNRAIAKKKSSPPRYHATKAYGPIEAWIDGTFGDWALSQGGSGAIIYMSLPLPAGILHFETDYPYVDGTALISVHLEYVPLDPPANAAAGKPHALRVRSKGTLAATNAVTVEALTFSGTQPNPIVPPLLRDMLEQWLNDNIAVFQHTFAVASVDALAAKDEWQWMKPTAQGYAYAQPGGPSVRDEDCLLGVLCMTGGAMPTGSYNVTPSVIPENARAGFVISGARYLEKVLMPHLGYAFEGATSSDFQLVPGTTQVKNIKPLTMHKLKGYTPRVAIGDFQVDLTAGELRVTLVKAHVPISPGIDLYLNYVIHAGCKLVARPDGTQALVVYDTADIEYDHEVQTAAWVTITEVIFGIVAGVLFTGIGSVGGKAASKALVQAGKIAEESFTYKFVKWLIAAIIGGVIGGLVGNIATIIVANAEQDADKMPEFDPFAKEATSTTNWADAGEAKITSVAFNMGLQLGIDPKFAE